MLDQSCISYKNLSKIHAILKIFQKIASEIGQKLTICQSQEMELALALIQTCFVEASNNTELLCSMLKCLTLTY